FRKWWTTTAEAAPRSSRSQTPPPAEAGDPSAGTLTGGSRKTDEVVLFADSCSNHFAPRILAAAVAVLEHAGVSARVSDQTVCCGLPLLATRQLAVPRANLSETITPLDATGDVSIVGVEPSSIATIKDDSAKLIADAASARVADRVQTLAQY